ncbi:MAG TPA: hypothetical protein DD621_04375 [Clostridiales bacterium]|nr:hypothetical protein [Clostridiales bacterium]
MLSKWSKEQKRQVIEYYFEHGKSDIKTSRKLGFPVTTILMDLVKQVIRWKRKYKIHSDLLS